MTNVEVLELALSYEKNAIKIYQKLLAEHPDLKDILYYLSNEEQRHKKLLEKKIYKLSS